MMQERLQRPGEGLDLVRGMLRRHGDAQSRRAACHGWIPDGGNKDALLAQSAGDSHGCGCITKHDGADGAGNCRVRNAECGIEFGSAGPQLLSALLAFI